MPLPQGTVPQRAPRAALGALLAAAALLFGACGSGGGGEGAATATTAAATTSSAPSSSTTQTCAPDDRDPTKLEPLMVGEVDGYRVEPDAVGDTGPSDLEKAIADDGEPDARQVLSGTGFRRGYQRLFRDGERALIVFLYEFCEERGADSYAGRIRRVMASGVEQHAVDTGGFADGFGIEGPDARGVFLWRIEGPHLVVVVGYADRSLPAADLQSRTLTLLGDQVSRLPGLT